MADKLVPKKFSEFAKVTDPTGCTFAGYNGTEDIQIDFSDMTPLFGISQTIGTSTTNAPSENAVNQALQDKAGEKDSNGYSLVYLPSGTFTIGSNVEFAIYVVDESGYLYFGIRRDGSTFIPKGMPEDVKKELLNYIKSANIQQTVNNSTNPVSSIAVQKAISDLGFSSVLSEFLAVIQTSDKQLLQTFSLDGSVSFPKNETYRIKQNPEFDYLITDSQKGIILGRRKNGSYQLGKYELSDKQSDENDKRIASAILSQYIDSSTAVTSSKMTHDSMFDIDNDGNVYLVCVRNDITYNEVWETGTDIFTELTVFNVNDFNTREKYVVGKHLDTVGGVSISSSVYDGCPIDLGDTVRFTCYGILSGDWHTISRAFNKTTKSFDNFQKCTLTYNNVTSDLNGETMKAMYRAFGFTNINESTIWRPSMNTRYIKRVENGTAYYYASLGNPMNNNSRGAIIKSSDLINWQLVSINGYNFYNDFEISIDIVGDNLFAAWRTGNGIRLTRYDIVNDKWTGQVYVGGTFSRPCLHYYNGKLYLLYNLTDDRNIASVCIVDTDTMEFTEVERVSFSKQQGFNYFFLNDYKGETYMSFSQGLSMKIGFNKVRINNLNK